jgi:hypothetical protein
VHLLAFLACQSPNIEHDLLQRLQLAHLLILLLCCLCAQARLEAFQTALSELVVYKSRINVALLQVRTPQHAQAAVTLRIARCLS